MATQLIIRIENPLTYKSLEKSSQYPLRLDNRNPTSPNMRENPNYALISRGS